MPDPIQHSLAAKRSTHGDDPLLVFLNANIGKPVTIDCASVDRLDSMRFQILAAAHAQWLNDGCGFELSGTSAGFLDGLERLGAERTLFSSERLS